MTRNDFNPSVQDKKAFGPCIGLLELSSVARGIEVADAILWQADVEILFSSPVQPGHYVLLFAGSVQDVRSSLELGIEVAQSDLIDRLLIEQIHDQIEGALKRKGGHINGQLDAIGVVETQTVASTIVAADKALKTATVDIFDLRIANGLGGKSFFALTGSVSDVRSSVDAGARSAEAAGQLTREVVIPKPHPDLAQHL